MSGFTLPTRGKGNNDKEEPGNSRRPQTSEAVLGTSATALCKGSIDASGVRGHSVRECTPRQRTSPAPAPSHVNVRAPLLLLCGVVPVLALGDPRGSLRWCGVGRRLQRLGRRGLRGL